MKQRQQFFWLHVKKSAGTTTRNLLRPYYVEVDRKKSPKNFIQASPEEYNDILNNYRVVLGEYQFKRCLFAKQYLYPGRWDTLISFAFSREPTDRCVSMFYYLFWRQGHGFLNDLKLPIRKYLSTKKLIFNTSYAFDVFLEYVQTARSSDSIYLPIDNHFTTHTAPMWNDVTDADGNILLKKIFRLEFLNESINSVFEECGISKRIEIGQIKLHSNEHKKAHTPTREQMRKIQELYRYDFELYENAQKP